MAGTIAGSHSSHLRDRCAILVATATAAASRYQSYAIPIGTRLAAEVYPGMALATATATPAVAAAEAAAAAARKRIESHP